MIATSRTKKKLLRRSLAIVIALIVLASVGQIALARQYTVQSGDTLSDIAEEQGVTVSSLASANGIDNPDHIFSGQTLSIPGTGGGSASYVVQPGDNIPAIAAQFGISPRALIDANGLANPDLIYPGQELVIPDASTAPRYTSGVYFDRATIRSYIVDIASAYGWDPYLIMALAWQESGWDQSIISWADAHGVMQLLPGTADWAGPALVGRQVDYVYSAWDNIETGVAYLTHLRSLTGSDYLALAAYYQGLGSVERDGIFQETRQYALNIIQMRDLFAAGTLP